MSESLLPPPLSRAERFADTAMEPLMSILGGFHEDSIQETHPWHVRRVSPEMINPSLCAEAPPDANAGSRRLFLFHAPGIPELGWKQYSIVTPDDYPFYIGWSITNRETGAHIDTAINRLRINDASVRMLNGPTISRVLFFAANEAGLQIPVKISGQGTLGSGKDTAIRLL